MKLAFGKSCFFPNMIALFLKQYCMSIGALVGLAISSYYANKLSLDSN